MSRVAEVVVTYLERPAIGGDVNCDPNTDAIAGARGLPPGVDLRHERPPRAGEIAAAMYHAVGAAWHWRDRAGWTAAQWAEAVHRDDVELWSARIDGAPIGYFELHVEAEAVDIKYFGLIPEFTNRGIGGPLLGAAIARASALRRGRVTVNTCTLDHPAALPNYLARGFRVVTTERQQRTLPE
jgi:GNAT superfamily N-acetyltransferase